jgi:NAD(P)-dependent dehydrogenase (short-subunit alcohol dehydrogenase family)
MRKMHGKVVLIAGGTDEVGLCVAGMFRDEGARVMVSGCDPSTNLVRTCGRLDVLFIDDVEFRDAFLTLKRAASLFGPGSCAILNITRNPALLSLARVAAAEWVERGIRVHAVRPGQDGATWYICDIDGVVREGTTTEEIAETALALAVAEPACLPATSAASI